MATIIDFEFTGLDNYHINDNEIIQMKVFCTESKKTNCVNFLHKKQNTIGATLIHKLINSPENAAEYFSKEAFEKVLVDFSTDFIGFSVSTDIKMLRKYGINVNIKDLQVKIMLCPKYEYKLATEGRGLECCYFIVTGKLSYVNVHSDISELIMINEIIEVIEKQSQNDFLEYFPYGYFAGTSLLEYCRNNREAADGYRFNNNDLLSRSLTNAIEELENEYCEENDYEDDDEY